MGFPQEIFPRFLPELMKDLFMRFLFFWVSNGFSNSFSRISWMRCFSRDFFRSFLYNSFKMISPGFLSFSVRKFLLLLVPGYLRVFLCLSETIFYDCFSEWLLGFLQELLRIYLMKFFPSFLSEIFQTFPRSCLVHFATFKLLSRSNYGRNPARKSRRNTA